MVKTGILNVDSNKESYTENHGGCTENHREIWEEGKGRKLILMKCAVILIRKAWLLTLVFLCVSSVVLCVIKKATRRKYNNLLMVSHFTLTQTPGIAAFRGSKFCKSLQTRGSRNGVPVCRLNSVRQCN